jgi:hypothetical protein
MHLKIFRTSNIGKILIFFIFFIRLMPKPFRAFLDKSLFDSIKDLDQLTCPLCQGVTFLPMFDKCKHIFCKRCIESHLNHNTNCPIDTRVVILDSLKHYENAEKLIRNKRIRCINKGLGCDWQGIVKDYTIHLNECSFNNFQDEETESFQNDLFQEEPKNTCIYEKCNSVFEDLTKHLQEKRPYHETLLMDDFKSFKKGTGKKIAYLDFLLSRKRKPSPQKKREERSPNLNQFNSSSNQSLYINEKFFQKEHSHNIFFRNNRARVEKGVREEFRFVFLNANLNNSSWKWRLKIINLNGYIGLGVCYKEDLIGKNFRYVEMLHHSTFVMCTDGNLWNCKNFSENGSFKEILRRIDRDDEIFFTYSHVKRKLTMTYKNVNMTLTKVDTQILMTLTPCIIFQYPEDEIEVLELNKLI